MFLTRFHINPARSGARRLLASPQRLHAAVLSAFPGSTADEIGRVLWRLDPVGPQVFLLITSPERPDLTHLVEQAGWPTLDTAWETRDYDPVLARLTADQQWAFRLTANPTQSLPIEPGQKRGRVVAIRSVERQLAWLATQGAKHGFSLIQRTVESLDAATGEPVAGEVATTRVTRNQVVRFKRESATVTLRVADFDGLLRVTDAEAFRSVLCNGMGSARAYGCGLMTIAPAR